MTKPTPATELMLTARNLAIVTSLAALSFVVQSVTTRLFLGTPKPIERKNALKKSLRYLLHRVFVATLLLDGERFQRWRQTRAVVWYGMAVLLLSMTRHVLYLAEERLEQAMLLASGKGLALEPYRRPIWQLAMASLALHALVIDHTRTALGIDSRPGASLHMLLIYDSLCFLIDVGLFSSKAKVLSHDEGADAEPQGFAYAEFVCKVLVGVLGLVHHCHAWTIKGLGSRMDVIMLFLLQSLLWGVVKRCWALMAAVRIARTIDSRYPDATPEDLAKLSHDDCCAICLRAMTTRVKKLPCGHLYHLQCLQSVLSQSLQDLEPSRCPLCRRDISTGAEDTSTSSSSRISAPMDPMAASPLLLPHMHQPMGGLDDVDGSLLDHPADRSLFRLTSDDLPGWLQLPLPIPSFHFEIVRRGTGSGTWAAPEPPTASTLDLMVDQVAEILPHWSREAILEDLTATGRVEETVERLLARDQQPVEETPAEQDEGSRQDRGRAPGSRLGLGTLFHRRQGAAASVNGDGESRGSEVGSASPSRPGGLMSTLWRRRTRNGHASDVEGLRWRMPRGAVTS